MRIMDLRSLQKPLKEQYRNDPSASKITIRANGSQTDAPIPARSTLGVPSTRRKLTRALEAAAVEPVPAIFYWERWRLARRLPARWWRRPWAFQPSELKSRWRETWICEVPLASKDVAVGFTAIRLRFDVAAPNASAEQVSSLKQKTEQYCVVMQTLRHPPNIETVW